MTRSAAIIGLLALLAAGCTSLEPVDLGRFEFVPPEQLRARSAPVVVVNRVQQIERRSGGRAEAGPVEYRWGDVTDRYAAAVADALAAELDERATTPDGGAAELGLDRLVFEQVMDSGPDGSELLDRVSAVWRLGYRDEIFAEAAVSGEARGPRAQSGRQGTEALDRSGRALQNLLVNTVDALSRDADFRRFARIPRIYLEPDRALEHARAALARDATPEMLAALRYRAVERGHADVYRLVAERARVDESDLLHAAICSQYHDPGLYARVLARSANPNQFDASRASVLLAALRCGRDALVQGLVDAGAHPVIELEGDAYVSAELNYRLTRLLRPGSRPRERAARYASDRYADAIAAAEAAIEDRRALAVVAPGDEPGDSSMPASAAQGAAALSARTGSMQAGLAGFDELIYGSPEIDLVGEDGAARYLQDRIRHCRARLQRLERLY